MAKATKSMSNADEVRRLQKAKQKAQVRKGAKTPTKVFSFGDMLADQKAARIAAQFGPKVDRMIHNALNAADASNGTPVVACAGNDNVAIQARWELTKWTEWHQGYATNNVNGTLFLVKVAKKAA